MSKICPHCSEQVKTTDIFCPFCGADLSKTSSTQDSFESNFSDSSFITCPYCGTSNIPTSQFCASCGTAMSASQSSSSGSIPPSSYDSISGQSSSQQESHSYGSYSTYSSADERKWYTPPKRTRSAKNPIEWFFWTGWGFYILIRVIFFVLWFIIRLAVFSKGRRM
ncbi:MAG: zinc ribbon domain-containing protein [Candidatus Thorarchaeota archaeon]